MKEKLKLFRDSVRLVRESAPGWTTVNIIVSLLRGLLPLLLVYLIKLLIDSITSSAANTGTNHQGSLLLLITGVTIVFLADEISSEFGSYVRKKQSLRLEEYMYDKLHSKAISIDLANFENPAFFDCLSRASREAPWRPNNILNNLISIFRGLISLLLMAGLLITLHWWISIMLIVVNIPGIWLRLHFASVLYNFHREQTPEARKSAYFTWLLTGDRPSRELRLFGLGNYFMERFKESFRKQKDEEINIIRKRTWIETVSSVFKASVLALVLYFVARETVNGALSLGTMAMLILAFRQGMLYLKELFGSVANLYEDSLFIGDTFEFLNLKEKIVAQEPIVKPVPFNDKIRFENLTFQYPGSSMPALNRISFEIRKNEIVAMVGHNGAGKTTLVKLLCRLYDPSEGRITFDNTDIRNMDPDLFRRQLSVVFQDFMLYNLSARENIRLGNIDCGGDDKRIRESAAATGIDRLISELPHGYETIIGNLFDDSRELSWGEWQKIALARALFRDAPVLILDEPSSAIDADAEYEIFSRFRELVKGKTAIIISHRFTNVKLADRILVLGNGNIEESGTHEELMMKKGSYFNMYLKQSSRFED